MATYLVTGGAGFIGSNFVHYLLWAHKDCTVINVDALTYAGNLENVADLADDPRHIFVRADICDADAMDAVFGKYGPDFVVNFAAESHVDRAIEDPLAFNRTNVEGALTLLQVARKDWEEPDGSFGEHKFLQVSTDEVYGSLPAGKGAKRFKESSLLGPRNPYSASKASAELYAMSYADTFGLPVIITRSSNNYGPYQHPEKLIPTAIGKVLAGEEVPLYGDGLNVRDWIYVADHCRALDLVLQKGKVRQIYNIGAENERTNIEIVGMVAEELAAQTGDDALADTLISYVEDRKGHDRRYGIDASKIRKKLGWAPAVSLDDGIKKTVHWYLNNQDWAARIQSGEYRAQNERYLQEWEQARLEAHREAVKAAEKQRKHRK